MIWWIDSGLNLILCAYFSALALQLLMVKKAILISGVMYCSMLMLGLFLLSLQDFIALNQGGWLLLATHWKGLLLYMGFFLYLILLPRMLREFYVFHISESDYRSRVASYMKQNGWAYSFDQKKYSIKTEQDPFFYSYYHTLMKYTVWSFKSGKAVELLKARKVLREELKSLKPYAFFSWQGFSFLFMALILLLRLMIILFQWAAI